MDNYKADNAYITDYFKGLTPPEEETNAMQEPMEEEIAEIRSSLDEKRRRVTNKRTKNGVATHLYLLMRVTL